MNINFMPVNGQHPQTQPSEHNEAVAKALAQKEAEQKVEKSQKRLKCTSVLLIIIGLLGVGSSLYHNFTAKHGAKRIMEKAHMMGNFQWNKDHQDNHEKPNWQERFVSRDEFDIYDTLKSLTVLSFFMSLIVLIFGKCGLKAIRFQKSNFTKCLLCKSKIAFGVLIVLTIATGFQFNEIHNVMERVRSNGMMKKNIWRLHKSQKNESFTQREQPFLGQNDACTYADQTSCDAVTECTWCKSAAVKSACKTVEMAKTLPASIFSCDKLQEEVPKVEDTCTYADQTSCDAVTECTWCKSAAVKSACKTVEMAKTLPASIFACDKLQEEVPIKVQDTCTYADQATCDGVDECSWCKSAAVKSACKTLEAAKTLPASIFACDKLSENEAAPEKSSFKSLFDAMNGKNQDLAKTYQEEDDQSDYQQDRHQRDHKNKDSKRQHDKHHPKGCCAMGPIIGLIIMIAHFCFMKGLHSSQVEIEKLNGTYEEKCEWRKKWGKCHKKNVVQEQEKKSVSPINYDYSIYENDSQVADELIEKKEDFSINATHCVQKQNHQMI